jgi:integrase
MAKGSITEDKRASGKVYYRVKKQHLGKRITYNFTTRKDAENWLKLYDELGYDEANRDYHLRRNNSPAVRSSPVRITVSQWCEEYSSSLIGVTDKHKNDCLHKSRSLGSIADIPLAEFSKEDHTKWLQEMVQSGRAGKTIKNWNGFLGAAMKQAVVQGLINSSPTIGAKLPPSKKREMVCLSQDEYFDFVQFIHPHYRLFVETLFFTGMRFGEATALNPKDIDKDQQTISINKAYGDTGGNTLKTPKTEAGMRKITIPGFLLDKILQHIEDNNIAPDDLIFRTVQGERIRHYFNRRVWYPALALWNRDEDMKIPKWLDPQILNTIPAGDKRPRVHDARHTCASWMLSANIPIHVVSRHLGHRNIHTTVNTYSHLIPRDKYAIQEGLGNILDNPTRTFSTAVPAPPSSAIAPEHLSTSTPSHQSTVAPKRQSAGAVKR